jgi:hypothetical protein
VSGFLSEKEIAELVPSELCPYQTPIPTQIVSSDEYYPDPQREAARGVEARLLAMADDLGKAGPRSRFVSAGRFGIGARYCVSGCSRFLKSSRRRMRYGWLKTQCVWSATSHSSAVTFLNGFTATPEVVRSIRSLQIRRMNTSERPRSDSSIRPASELADPVHRRDIAVHGIKALKHDQLRSAWIGARPAVLQGVSYRCGRKSASRNATGAHLRSSSCD